MRQIELYNFTLPPDRMNAKPHVSRWKMTIEEAARRHPGAVPILSSKEVRSGTATTGASIDFDSSLSAARLKPRA